MLHKGSVPSANGVTIRREKGVTVPSDLTYSLLIAIYSDPEMPIAIRLEAARAAL